jgi:hypothetical protein
MQKITAQETVRQMLGAPEALRPPAWRFLVAQQALANPVTDLSPLGGDNWLLEGAVYYRESRLRELNSKRRLPKIKQALAQSFTVYYSAPMRSGRWAVEAMVLTGAKTSKIADKTKLPEAVIEAYKKMFWDVDLFLDDPDALRIGVLPVSYGRLGQGMAWDLGWKLAAIEDGWDGLLNVIRQEPDSHQSRRLFQRQMHNAMSMADHALQGRPQDLNEQALSAIGVAQNYWKLSLDARMLAMNQQQAAADSFFNALLPIVEGHLRHAEPTDEAREQLLL